MRHGLVMLTMGFAVALSLVVRAAEKPSPEHVKAMKDLSASVQALAKPEAASDFELADKSATTVKTALEVVKKYWDKRGDIEAKKLTDAAVRAASDLDVSARLSSTEGVAVALKDLRATCAPCHTAYRTQLEDKSYEIK